MTLSRPPLPHDSQAFQRMIARAAAGIDRARAARGMVEPKPAAPRRPSPGGAGLTAPTAPVWPPPAAERPADSDQPANPYDLLKQASRAREREAAHILASRLPAKPPPK